MTRRTPYLALPLALCAAACSSGSVTAGDVKMSVADAIYWTVSGTGDPGADGAVLVLMSETGGLCDALTTNHFDNGQLLALELFSGSSEVATGPGAYEVGTEHRRAEGRLFDAESGCRPPVGRQQLVSGTLTVTGDPAQQATLHGSFKGTLGPPDGAATITFSASSCDGAAAVMTGLARELKFRSCQ